MTGFDITRLPLPRRAHPNAGSYGTSLVRIPETTSLIMSLPSGGASTPWCVVDVVSGEVRRGVGMPGDLRAVVHNGTEPPWALATYGLGRLHLEPKLRVTDVVRKGIGKYRTTLIRVDHELLGIGHRDGKTLLLVSAVDGTPVRRIKLKGPHLAYRLANGLLRVVGVFEGEATDFDTTTRQVTARHPLAEGTSALHHGDELLVLRSEFAVLDAESFAVRRVGPVPEGAVEIAGIDRDGRIVVGTTNGFVLVDPDSFAVLDRVELPQLIDGVGLLPEHNAAGLLVLDHEGDDALHAVRW